MAEKIFVCDKDDLKEGEMRAVEVAGGKVLLIRQKDGYFATGAKCSHYGAPLAKGALYKDKVRCPWHGACFNIKTGDIEDFPGLCSIPTFKVSVDGGKVYVHADAESVAKSKRTKTMVACDSGNKQIYLLLGGGPTSVSCAETLRQEGFTGRIVIATKEKDLPYDRPKLSKAMTVEAASIALRDAAFYKEHNIEIQTNKEAVSINSKEKTVKFASGESMTFDKLLVATGGTPRTISIPGVDLKNVCILRTPADANYIAQQSKAKNVVIIGSSFIGLEVASTLVSKAKSVVLLCRKLNPLEPVFGAQIGSLLRKMHEDKGIKFHFEQSVKELIGDKNGSLTTAVLTDGTKLAADICILGIGVVPATDFLKYSGIAITTRGFVPVNKNMETNYPYIYAGGDIVEFPLYANQKDAMNIQHWQMALKHGQIAGKNMAGKVTNISTVPFFWTVQYGKSIRYAGYGAGYDDVIMTGDLSAPNFVAYYTKGDKVVAVASLNTDPVVAQFAQFIGDGGALSKAEIQEDDKAWIKKLSSS